jgi:hypothetical protein
MRIEFYRSMGLGLLMIAFLFALCAAVGELFDLGNMHALMPWPHALTGFSMVLAIGGFLYFFLESREKAVSQEKGD